MRKSNLLQTGNVKKEVVEQDDEEDPLDVYMRELEK